MDGQKSSESPEVYALRQESGNWRISRRIFLKAAGIGTVVLGTGLNSGCSPKKPTDTGETEPVSTEDDNRTMELSALDPDTGETLNYSMPCGAAIPKGAVCNCNCVYPMVDWCLTDGPATPTVSESSNGDGGSGGGHYWHPN